MLPGFQSPTVSPASGCHSLKSGQERNLSVLQPSFQEARVGVATEVRFNIESIQRRPGPLPTPTSVPPGFAATAWLQGGSQGRCQGQEGRTVGNCQP